MLSSPPDTTQRPSGVNLIALTPRVWPLYVWIHPFFLISHILRFVSKDPEAKNSPKGWKSTEMQLDLWPVSVRTTRKYHKRNPENRKYRSISQYNCPWKLAISNWTLSTKTKEICMGNRKHTFSLLQIPKFDCATSSPCSYQHFWWVKAYRIYSARMASQTLDVKVQLS